MFAAAALLEQAGDTLAYGSQVYSEKMQTDALPAFDDDIVQRYLAPATATATATATAATTTTAAAAPVPVAAAVPPTGTVVDHQSPATVQ